MKETIQSIHAEIDKAKNIVITAHKSPDGDSVGSSLGLFHYLKSLGKNVQICHPDKAPNFLSWMNGFDTILTMEKDEVAIKQHFQTANLIFALDYNSLHRIGDEMGKLFKNSTASKVMIDHHLHPEDFADLVLSEPEICSTSQLVYELVELNLGTSEISPKIGTPLYLGIVTDTGSFRFQSVEQRTHEIAGNLIAIGVNHTAVYENTFDTNSLDRLKLRGFATSEKLELIHHGKVSVISLSEEELQRFNYRKGDTEGLVNVALSITGVKTAALFMQKDGKIKISFRAKEDYAVNQMASELFSGGGHKFASGGIFEGTMQDAIQKYKENLDVYFK